RGQRRRRGQEAIGRAPAALKTPVDTGLDQRAVRHNARFAERVAVAVETRPRRGPVERTGDRRDDPVPLRDEIAGRFVATTAVIDVDVIPAGEPAFRGDGDGWE